MTLVLRIDAHSDTKSPVEAVVLGPEPFPKPQTVHEMLNPVGQGVH